MNTTEAPEVLIQELENLANEFKRVLSVETTVMENRSADALPDLTEQKNQIVAELQNREADMIGLLTDHQEDESVKSLKTTLKECQQLNRKNQTIALLELKHTQNSLELLRSLLMLDDLPLYSSEGHIKVNREKRNLGCA